MVEASSVADIPATPGIGELRRYGAAHPEERAAVDQFIEFALSGADIFERTRVDGHFTASCWLVSGDGERVLLTHHRKLGRWLQLGGHADGEDDLAQVALREAQEESGLADLWIDRTIYDIDAHVIPACGDEPAHVHWDVRFVLRCLGSEEFSVSAESLALAWVAVDALLADPAADPSLRRMAAKWRDRQVLSRTG